MQSAENWAEIGRISRETHAAISRVVSALSQIEDLGFAHEWQALQRDIMWQVTLLNNDFEDQGHDRHDWTIYGEPTGPERHRYDWSVDRSRTLTREQWVIVGDDIKLCRNMLVDLGCGLQDAFGDRHLTVKQAKPWRKLTDRISTLKRILEGTARKQHPNWGEPLQKVMFGDMSVGMVGPRKDEWPDTWRLPPDSKWGKIWYAARMDEQRKWQAELAAAGGS